MSGKSHKKAKFISLGKSILKGQQSGPGNMEEFLEDSKEKGTRKVTGPEDPSTKKEPQMDTNTFAQKPKSTFPQSHECERLHVQIRKDLADKLLEMAFRRKCDSKNKRKKTTQRAIIEEALEEFFSKRSI